MYSCADIDFFFTNKGDNWAFQSHFKVLSQLLFFFNLQTANEAHMKLNKISTRNDKNKTVLEKAQML